MNDEQREQYWDDHVLLTPMGSNHLADMVLASMKGAGVPGV